MGPSRSLPARAPFLLLCGYAFLTVAWVFGNPVGAAPDEPDHYVRAVAIAHGQIIGDPPKTHDRLRFDGAPQGWSPTQAATARGQAKVVQIPARLAPPESMPCNAFLPGVPADCPLEPPAKAGSLRIGTYMGTYPPLAYAIAAPFVRAADDPSTGIYLGRLAIATVHLVFLALAVAMTWRPSLGSFSLLGPLTVVSPMAVFSGASLNPSGVEIAAGIAFVSALLRVARDRALARLSFWTLLTSGVVLVCARPPGPAFGAIGIALFVRLVGRRGAANLLRADRRAQFVLLVVSIAAISTIAWQLSVPETVFARTSLGRALGQAPAEAFGLEIVEQAIGVFGWLDTRMMYWGYLAWTYIWVVIVGAAFLVGKPAERTSVVLTALAVAIAMVMVAVPFVDSGFGPQGRWYLPIAVAIPLLSAEILLARGRSIRLGGALVAMAAVVAASVHALGFWMNARRHSVGIQGPIGFLGTGAWEPPLGWGPWILAAGLGCLCILVAGLTPMPSSRETVR